MPFSPSTASGRSSGVSVAVTNTSATTLLSAIPGGGPTLRLANTGSDTVHYAIVTGALTASTTDAALPAGVVEYIRVGNEGISTSATNLGIALISPTSSTLQISRGNGD